MKIVIQRIELSEVSMLFRVCRRHLPCLCFLLVLGCGRFEEERPVEMQLDADWLPYRVVTARTANGRMMNWNTSRTSLPVDIDGDGVDERAKVSHPYARVDWHRDNPNASTTQFNLPPGFLGSDPCGWVDGAWDLDDDGLKDMIIGSVSDVADEFRYWAIHPITHQPILEFSLPVGTDHYGDGSWDGSYTAVGTIDVPTDEGDVRALVMICHVRYDEFDRRIFAVDVRDGKVLWSRDFANSVEGHTVYLLDADGDGSTEIVCVGQAMRNLDAEEGDHVEGLRDDVLRAFCFDAAGEKLWSLDLDDVSQSAGTALCDLDGDGVQELAIGTAINAGGNRLMIVDIAAGTIRWSLGVHERQYRLLFREGDRESGPALLSKDREYPLRGFRVVDDVLVTTEEARPDIDLVICAVGDCLPPEGQEIIAVDLETRMVVLSGDYEVLARSEPMPGVLPKSARFVSTADGARLVSFLAETGNGWRWRLLPADRPLPWLWIAVVSAALALIAGFIIHRRSFEVMPVTLRERRLALLERLEVAGHGQIGALRSLRRLVVKTVLAMGMPEQGRDVDSEIEVMAEKLCRTSLPRLRATLDLAEASEVPGHRVERARASLVDLEKFLTSRDRDHGHEGRSDQAASLRRRADEVEGAFQMLRRDVLAQVSSSLDEALDGVREGLEEALRDVDATLSCEGPSGLRLRCYDEDLEYILDNLCHNALRAMTGAAHRRLELSWTLAGDRLDLRVADTGCGIAADDWDAVFEFGVSSREGGGEGLPRSREKLRRYGGTLVILESRPAEGSVFRLRLPVVDID